MTVHIGAEDTHTVGLPQQLGLLSVSEGINAAVLCGGEDVIAVGIEARDALVGQDGVPLQRQAPSVQTVDALVRT